MLINQSAISGLTTGFKNNFNKGFKGVESQWPKLAMSIASGTTTEQYPWLDEIPGLREWVGDKHVRSLKALGYSITNLPYELTIGVKKHSIADKQYGIYGPLMSQMGYKAGIKKDERLMALIAAAASTVCYDDSYFLSATHPTLTAGVASTTSNYDASGGGNLWMLLDTRQALKPFIMQNREEMNFVNQTSPTDDCVFENGEIRYGVEGRFNVGFGFWQMAYGSLNTLNATNLKAARTAMRAFSSDADDTKLGINPDVLLVGGSNEAAAEELLDTTEISGTTNTLYKKFELVVSPWLD